VYYYFKTKGDVIAAVVDAHVKAIEQEIGSLERYRTPAARLKALITTLARQADAISRFGCPHGTLCAELGKRTQAGPEAGRSSWPARLDASTAGLMPSPGLTRRTNRSRTERHGGPPLPHRAGEPGQGRSICAHDRAITAAGGQAADDPDARALGSLLTPLPGWNAGHCGCRRAWHPGRATGSPIPRPRRHLRPIWPQASAPIQHAVRKRRETTGTIRTNGTREGAAPLPHGRARPHPWYLGRTAAQRHRTSNPVTARPMIIRWISEVPSKMVKLSVPGTRDQDMCSLVESSPGGRPMASDGNFSLFSGP
jgi:AcrR family transcriptional regulator